MQYRALVADYDGTLAHDGHVQPAVIEALRRLRASGRHVILVTGRILAELMKSFPDLALCDVVVAENGAVLHWPAEERKVVLGEPPPDEFIAEMHRQNVKPFAVGDVIFATWHPHEAVVLETIERLGLGHQIILNKGAVMVLPAGVNKASGLATALKNLALSETQLVGVGDAENDHVFLDACAVAVAVANALPAVQRRCDLVMTEANGRGIVELIDRLLEDDLQSLGPRRPRRALFTSS